MAPYLNKFRSTIFLIITAVWSVNLVNKAADQGYEPFQSIATRARVERFYQEYAPEKISEVPSIIQNNGDKGPERLYKRLENKYGSPVNQLEFGPLIKASLFTCWEKFLDSLPYQAQNEIDMKWNQFQNLTLSYQIFVITIQALIAVFTLQLFGFNSVHKMTTFIILWIIFFLTLFRPLPSLQDCQLSNLKDIIEEIWLSLPSSREQLWLLTVIGSIFLFLQSPTDRKFFFFCYLVLCFYLTNPSIENFKNSNYNDLLKNAIKSVSGKDQSSKLINTLPKGVVAINDLGLVSIMTFSKTLNHHWNSPVLAVGMGGNWLGLVELATQQSGMMVKGLPIAAWNIPCLLGIAIWGLIQLF